MDGYTTRNQPVLHVNKKYSNMKHYDSNERTNWHEKKFMAISLKNQLKQQERFMNFIIKKHLGRFDKFLLKIMPVIFVRLFPNKVKNLHSYGHNYGVQVYKNQYWLNDYIDNGIEIKSKKDIDDARDSLYDRP